MDLGNFLRNAREQADLSLQDLVARTKIPEKALRAIEKNDFTHLPGGIFARSFICSYAREVGVDPATAVAEYRAIAEPPVDPAEPQKELAKLALPHSDFRPELLESPRRWSWGVAVAALVISVVIFKGTSGSSGSQHPAVPQQVISSLVATASAETPQPAATPPPVVTSGAGIQLVMFADRMCWVRAVVDGQEAIARLMYPGESETLTGQRDVVMRVGDPSALSYWINGQPGASLGAPEVPVTVRFGPDGKIARGGL